MFNNDIKVDYKQKMMEALKNDNTDAYIEALDGMMLEVAKQTSDKFEAMQQEKDTAILQARGIRQLTSEESKFYQKLDAVMRADNPKQALVDANLVIPETVFTAVFDELQDRHPLLAKIDFLPAGGNFKMLMNTNEYQQATWGNLCDTVIKEVLAGFKEVDTGLLKLSAFIPVCKGLLDLGPAWLDSFVRQTLYEVLANGLEYGIVTGNGNGQPIGMDREVGKGVAVVGGVYPQKTKIKVTNFDANTIGNLLSIMAVNDNGQPRALRDIVLLVNPVDYYAKVMPATTVMAPDGTYRNNVLPYPMTIIESSAIEVGEAIIGIAYKYFAGAGMGREGRIEYSDHYQFLEDNRVYLIKLYANGFPMDNNAFLRLDISDLQPKTYKVETVTGGTPSNVADLTSLKVGGLALTPAFASATTTYAVSTTNGSNTVSAIPTDASAEVEITVNGETVANGTPATWSEGENTVVATVTAADGTTKAYTVTVTKA